MKVVAMIPIKLNSQRFPGKNMKRFDDGTPLIHLIQKAVLGSRLTTEAYVYCSSEEIVPYLLPGVCFKKRPEFLDQDSINSNNILREFLKTVDADIYYTTHATGPFTRSSSLDNCIRAVQSGEYDSAFIAQKMQQFVWSGNKPLNFDPAHLPRTQDLEPLYVETSDAFVFTKEVFHKYGRRVGCKPYICEARSFEEIDIDYPDDFEVANAIYMNTLRKQ
ncbi:cytidylyltransferase domain-containing protein [Allofournierella sp.]|uniref:acylneuraminate cytidylyltransferase family protein n=1 Tax=Allofournierella sp. TaxID=1940256 RepID=UPI003AB37D94